MAAKDAWRSRLRNLQKQMDIVIQDARAGKVPLKEARAKVREFDNQLKELEIEWRQSIGWPLNKTLKRFASRKAAT